MGKSLYIINTLQILYPNSTIIIALYSSLPSPLYVYMNVWQLCSSDHDDKFAFVTILIYMVLMFGTFWNHLCAS